jgi:hypothetical protein
MMSREPREYYSEKLQGDLGEIAERLDELEYSAGDEQWPDLLEEATEAVAAVGRSYDRVAKLVGRMLPEEQ